MYLSGGWKQALQQRAKAKSKLRCEACKQWLKYYRLSMGRQRKQKTVWWEWTKGAYQLGKSPKKSLQQGAISPIWCLSCPKVRPFFFSIWFYPVRSNKNVSTISFSFRWGFWGFFIEFTKKNRYFSEVKKSASQWVFFTLVRSVLIIEFDSKYWTSKYCNQYTDTYEIL